METLKHSKAQTQSKTEGYNDTPPAVKLQNRVGTYQRDRHLLQTSGSGFASTNSKIVTCNMKEIKRLKCPIISKVTLSLIFPFDPSTSCTACKVTFVIISTVIDFVTNLLTCYRKSQKKRLNRRVFR